MSKGIIVCGHGRFAEGLTNSVEMIAGKQADYEVVIFRDDAPFEKLQEDLENAMHSLLKSTDGVVFCCDLLGGSPFKSAMMIANDQPNCAVIVGTNLPLLLDLSLSRGMNDEEDVHQLARRVVESGREGLMMVEKIVVSEVENDFDGEGI